jgi:hypothetical protein
VAGDRATAAVITRCSTGRDGGLPAGSFYEWWSAGRSSSSP